MNRLLVGGLAALVLSVGSSAGAASSPGGARAIAATAGTAQVAVPKPIRTVEKTSCTRRIAYRELEHDAAALRGRCITEKGQVFEYDRRTGRRRMLVDVTSNGFGTWDTTVELDLSPGVRGTGIGQDDIVEFRGTIAGRSRITTEFGGTKSVPVLDVEHLTLVSSQAGTASTPSTT